MREPNKNLESDAPLAALESWLMKLIREEIQTLKAELNGQGSVNIGTKEWLRAGEAAQLYGLPKTWFEERGRAGDIERAKPGRYVIFKRRDIEVYLEKHKKYNDQ